MRQVEVSSSISETGQDAGSSAKILTSPAFRNFARSRRGEAQDAQGTLSRGALLAEWRALSQEARTAFEGSGPPAKQPGSSISGQSSAAAFLRQQQQKAKQPRPVDSTAQAQPKKRRKEAVPEVQLPAPAFPRYPAEPPAGREARRRELAESLRLQTSSRGSEVSVVASHSVDLAEVQAHVTAPTLSFDWSANLDALSDEDEAREAAPLEVDVPTEVDNSGGVRGLLRDQLARHVSAARVTALIAKAAS